jgi:hypothetical protein
MEDTRKKKFLNSAGRDVGRRSSDICSQVCCRVFAYVVSTKRQIGLILEIWSFLQREYNLDENRLFQSACNVLMYLAII